MRRNRMRSYTIDAENEEEFIKEYERMKKSRLSEMVDKDNNEEEQILETDENLNKQNNLDDDDYSGLGGLTTNLDEDEEDYFEKNNYDENDILRGSEEDLINRDNNEEKGIEILCCYLKNSINELMNDTTKKNKDCIFYKNNKSLKALSCNAIYDINIRDLVDNLLTENDNEYMKSNEGNNNSLRDYIFQNIESDNTLKIMLMSNNKSTKNALIKKLFILNDNSDNDYSLDEPFEIRKKQIKLFNKNIALQIYDTSDEFHKNKTSSIYYEKISAFFIFIEASNHNAMNYLHFIYEKINKYIINKTCIIFGVNMLFNEDCTIDGDNLRDYANENNSMFIPLKINDFDLKNNVIKNIFNLILIKNIDNKQSKDSKRKMSNYNKLKKFKKKITKKIKDSSQKTNLYDITKMNIPSSLGYKKIYRIKHINAFDLEDNNTKYKRRNCSADI
jgi:hypothetical protein